MIAYLIQFVLAVQNSSNQVYFQVLVASQILYPVFLLGYWALLIKGKLE